MREATVLATHEAAGAAIRDHWRSISVDATVAQRSLTVEVRAASLARLPNREDADQDEAEPIEPWQLINALIDEVHVRSDRDGTTVVLVQRLEQD